jgi:WhiB family transcriptional regulator, redox-sensing transcriptional regulator
MVVEPGCGKMTRKFDSPLYVLDLFGRPDWFDEAACRGHPVDIFYPTHENKAKRKGVPKREPNDSDEVIKAKEVCRDCPVQEVCLEYAMNNRIDYGVWGGMTWPQRLSLRRQQARKKAKP